MERLADLIRVQRRDEPWTPDEDSEGYIEVQLPDGRIAMVDVRAARMNEDDLVRQMGEPLNRVADPLIGWRMWALGRAAADLEHEIWNHSRESS